jgi:hypothetical protein
MHGGMGSTMNDEWQGEERRTMPHEYQLREIIRDELRPIRYQQEQLRKEQAEITTKILEWELGAKWFRVFIIATVGLVTTGAAVYEWLRAHIK